MEKKNSRRIAITKQMIKDAFVELLETQDIHKLSIRSLCESADVNRSTFYKYYGSQYDILEEMENNFLAEIEKGIKAVTITDSYIYLANVLTFFKANKKMCRLLISDTAHQDFKKNIFNMPIIVERLKIEVHSYNEEEFKYFQNFIMQGMYGIVVQWIENDFVEDPIFIAKLMTKLIEKLV